MLTRSAESQVLRALQNFPAVALLGPRQVGKTTLARQIAATFPVGRTVYLDLERPSDAAKLEEPELYLRANKGKLVIMDEIQRAPEIFRVLRALIDERRADGERGGQFLLLGSASIELLRQSAETLAGRIAYIHLGGLTAEEVAHGKGAAESGAALDRLWLRGGFPDSFLAGNDEKSFAWREAFIRTYLERDIPALGPRIPTETLRRFWTMLAHNQGALQNAARLAAGLGVSGQTVARYTDLLVDLLLVRTLRPWSQNTGKRLVKSPKVFIRDSGITHTLLGIRTSEELFAHPVVGGSWEGFVIENILAAAGENATACFYRTAAGAEIDLVLERGAGKITAIEIKRTLAPKLSPGFMNGCRDIDAKRRFVVYPGTERFPIGEKTEALPLLEVMREVRAR